MPSPDDQEVYRQTGNLIRQFAAASLSRADFRGKWCNKMTQENAPVETESSMTETAATAEAGADARKPASDFGQGLREDLLHHDPLLDRCNLPQCYDLHC